MEAGGEEINQEAESTESDCQGCEEGEVKDHIRVSDISDWVWRYGLGGQSSTGNH